MNGRKDRVEAIFQAAMELNSPQEREAYLERECGEDSELRREVEELLRAAVEAEEVFESRAHSAALEQVGSRIGHYHLLQKIGEGGCGVVYMAEQEAPVRRKVALKIVKLGMDTRQVIARFEAERQALALMDHPNIAKVLSAGATEAGRPYFVMELVRGRKITRYCDEQRYSTGRRLELFIQVCQAVQHAHQKGVIHRDLKPSNILVTERDGVPVPKVIDFGIAKATGDLQLTDKTLFTAFEQFIGTPAYMSPEQARLGELDVDTRSDIYSLGVLLYELLSGKTPFDSRALLAAGLDEIRRTIQEKEPAKPSTRLTTLDAVELTSAAMNRGVDGLKLIQLLRGDLDWIIMKCLEKDRTRRYETAIGLASDIQRHFQNEPVVARPPSKIYRFQKLVRRNLMAFSAGTAVIAALALGLGFSLWQYIEKSAAYTRAVAAEREQGRLRTVAEAARAGEAKQRSLAEATRFAVQGAYRQLENQKAIESLAADDVPAALAYLASILRHNPSNSLSADLLVSTLTYGRLAFEEAQTNKPPPFIPLRHHMGDFDFSPDGQKLLTASRDGVVQVWDAQSRNPLSPALKNDDQLNSAHFSPDSQRFLAVSSRGSVNVWECATWHSLRLPQATHVLFAEFSPDSQRLVTGSVEGIAQVWDAKTGGALTEPMRCGRPIAAAQFSPEGQRVLTISEGFVARVWDAGTGLPLIQPISVFGARFSLDGLELGGTSTNSSSRTWYIGSRQALPLPFRHDNVVSSAEFSKDGRYILTASHDGTARVWDALTGRPTTGPLKHMDAVNWAEFSPDGHLLVTASNDRTARIWDARTGQPLTNPLRHDGRVCCSRFSPDGQQIVTAADDNSARVWDVRTGNLIGRPLKHDNRVLTAQFSPDGQRVVTASWDSTAQVWDARTGEPVSRPLRHKMQLWSAVFSPDGKLVATASSDRTARVWDARTGQP